MLENFTINNGPVIIITVSQPEVSTCSALYCNVMKETLLLSVPPGTNPVLNYLVLTLPCLVNPQRQRGQNRDATFLEKSTVCPPQELRTLESRHTVRAKNT